MNTLQIKGEVNVETASMIQDSSDWFVSRCLFHLFCVSYWSSFGCLLLYLPVVKKLILSILLTYGDKWTNEWIILLMSTFMYTCDYCANRIQFQTRHLRVTAADRLKTYRVYFKDFLDSTTLPFLPSPSAPIPSLHSPPLLLEVGPLNRAMGLGSVVGSPSGAWDEAPAEVWILVHFSLKIWHLVSTVLMIFLRINWPDFVQKQYTEYPDTESCVTVQIWSFWVR